MMLKIYCDGSYDNNIKEYSGAFVILDEKDNIIEKRRLVGNDSTLIQHRNITGEVIAAAFSIRNAMKHNPEQIDLYHDYSGIELWAIGEWKTNHVLTMTYKKIMGLYMRKLPIMYHRVKGHTGDLWNTYVDKLTRDTGLIGEELIHVEFKDITALLDSLIDRKKGGANDVESS